MKQLITILLLFSSLCYSQDIKVEWSEKEREVKLNADVITALPINNKVIAITGGKKNFAHSINQDMEIEKSLELDLGKKELPMDLFSDGETTFLFTIETSKKTKTNIKRIYYFDNKQLKVGKKLGEASSYYNSKSMISFRNRDYFSESTLSENKEWIAQITENKVKGDERISVSLFLAKREDDLINKTNNIKLPFTAKEFSLLDAMVDDFGYITILGVQKDGNEQKKLKLYTYMRNLEDVIVTDLELKKGKFFVGNAAIKSKDKKIFVGGFYNEKNKNWAEGVVFYELDGKRNVLSTSAKSIERADFLKTGEKNEEKALKKKKGDKVKAQKRLTFLDVVSDGDGGYYMVSEQVNQYTETNYRNNGPGGGMVTTSVTYLTDFESLVISYIKDSEIQWNQAIPKSYRRLIGWHDYSTQTVILNGQNYLIYASKTDKETLEEADIESRLMRNIGLFMVPLKQEGNLDPMVISGGKEKVALPLPGNVFQVNENTILLIGKKPKAGATKLLLGDTQGGKASIGKITMN